MYIGIFCVFLSYDFQQSRSPNLNRLFVQFLCCQFCGWEQVGKIDQKDVLRSRHLLLSDTQSESAISEIFCNISVANQQKQGQTVPWFSDNIFPWLPGHQKALYCTCCDWLSSTGLHQNNWILRDFVCCAFAWQEVKGGNFFLMLPTCCWRNIELLFGGEAFPLSLGQDIFRLQSKSGGLRNNSYWGVGWFGGRTPFSLLIPHPSHPPPVPLFPLPPLSPDWFSPHSLQGLLNFFCLRG